MNDLISREETISYIENWKEVNKYYHPYTKNTNIPIDEVIQVIKDVPSNNQKIGHWILADEQNEADVKNDNYRYICSGCGHSDIQSKSVTVPYCWFCGSKMEGENND